MSPGSPGTRTVVIFLYNRLFDPLIQGNFWLYVRSLMDDPDAGVRLHVVTFEDPRIPITAAEEARLAAWRSAGLEWTPLAWHAGTGIIAKCRDVAAGFLAVLRLRRRGHRHIVALASVAGTFAYLYAVLLRMRLFLYQFEPHSEYAVDNGMWSPTSLQTRLSRVLERRAARYATVVASGTRFMRERLTDPWRSPARFVLLPTVVDDRKFRPDPALRREVRQELGLDARQPVLLYPGKFGDLYYGDETAWMFRWFADEHPGLHLLVVTPHNVAETRRRFERAGLEPHRYHILQSGYDRIHRYYCAADVGIIAVPPGPSKKFISNIKVGEYLCAGLPYLITRGVSEDYLFAEENDVGVVVDDFSERSIRAAWPRLRGYLERDPEALRQHCRSHGLAYRGFDTLNPRFRDAMDILTASRPSGRP